MKIFPIFENNIVKVKLSNLSSAPLRVWEQWNSWGWGNFSFYIKEEEYSKVYKIYRDLGRDWTVNYPSYIEIPPGGYHEFKIDIKDGSWSYDPGIDDLRNKRILVQTVFQINPSTEAIKFQVFTGDNKSEWTKCNPPHKWLFSGK